MTDRAIPHQGERPIWTGIALALALVFACFTMASTSYLAWLYRLMGFAPSLPADAIALVGGYAFQALGIGLGCAAMKASRRFAERVPFAAAVAVHFACAAAAILAADPVSLVALGFLMNLMCGVVAFFYLQRLVQWAPKGRRGLAFGGGYACSVATTWALSLVHSGAPLGTPESIVACTVLAFAAIGLIAASQDIGREPGKAGRDPEGPDLAEGDPVRSISNILSIACITVLLLSLVKNMGFSFPSADLMEGVSLESSRLFYAAGLLVAGFIADANRKYAAHCCIAALVFPFACLALANEPLPGTILWACDYLFFGFFSVYRVVLFCDIAEESGRDYLAGFGLMFGRLGDALGTALHMALISSTVALVAVSAALFAATVFAFYHLFGCLYPARPEPRVSHEVLFAQFAASYGLSIRERDVLRLVLDGRTNAEIAAELFITEGTVKFHVHNLLVKTECASRKELLAKFAEETA